MYIFAMCLAVTEDFSCPFCLVKCASFKVDFHFHSHSYLSVKDTAVVTSLCSDAIFSFSPNHVVGPEISLAINP